MKYKIQEIFASCDVDLYYKGQESAIDYNRYKNWRLTEELVHHIKTNLVELPIEVTTTENIYNNKENTTWKMILISKDELKRLQEIEYMYNDLCR